MRLLIICFLFSLSLSGQTDMDYDAKYVWARSGLTLRADGSADAAKIGVLPFGAKVLPTYRMGEQAKVVALPAVSYDLDGEVLTSDAYVMNNYYIEVVSGQDTGYVYDGYLSYFPCLVPGMNSANGSSLDKWLTWLGGVPDTIAVAARRADHGRPFSIMHYQNGVVTTSREMEGGSSYLMAFPMGSLKEGYLIAEYFLGAGSEITGKKKAYEADDLEPESLTIEEDGTLSFADAMSGTRIYVVGDMLFIYTEGGC